MRASIGRRARKPLSREHTTGEAADQHDALTGGFTDDGALSYDTALDFFTYRVRLSAEVDLVKIRRRR